jgi:genome maintenance exonuclease 1
MKTFRYLSNRPKLEPLPTEEIDGQRFYITPTGKKLPSVTTVLGHSKKQMIFEWRKRVGQEEANKISTRASIRGTKFHNMLEKYLCNEEAKLIFEDVMPDMKQAFKDIQSTIDLIDNIHYIESPLYSEVLGVAGRTDVIAEYAGVPSIIDFKTSTKEKKEEWIQNYFEQGTAYSLMYEEMTGRSVNQIVIIISVDGMEKPQIFVKNRIDYVDSLIEKIENYKKEHSNVY